MSEVGARVVRGGGFLRLRSPGGSSDEIGRFEFQWSLRKLIVSHDLLRSTVTFDQQDSKTISNFERAMDRPEGWQTVGRRSGHKIWWLLYRWRSASVRLLHKELPYQIMLNQFLVWAKTSTNVAEKILKCCR